MFAVVTGGGTSGHVIPALAVIEALEDSGIARSEIAYVGARRGVETTMVPPTGVTCEFLPVSGLQRSFAPRSLARNIALPFRLVRSVAAARRLVREWKPSVVVSVGGYASEPMARAAVAAGVPLVCVSYDRTPGLATRRQSRRAAVCAVAYPGSDLPRAVVTGAPVRRAVRTMDPASSRTSARGGMDVGESTCLVTVVGGSLGSKSLNDAVPAIVAALSDAGVDARVHHVTGPRFAGASGAAPTAGVNVNVVAYENDMPSVLVASDVVVSRAGASTVAEIATLGVASVLVPWPGASENHQMLNARWLSDGGAAVVVEEGSDLPTVVAAEVVRLARDPAARQALRDTARAMGGANRSNALAEAITNAASR